MKNKVNETHTSASHDGGDLKIWKLEWDNDTGPNDEYYREWYNLINPDGETVGQITHQREANQIVKALNESTKLAASNLELKEALCECFVVLEAMFRYPNQYPLWNGDHSKERYQQALRAIQNATK